jgi:epoxyqueuosine reductase QueG
VKKDIICNIILNEGFSRVRFLSPFDLPEGTPERYRQGTASLAVAALAYGNLLEERAAKAGAVIAGFARRNYYREAVKRLQRAAAVFRSEFGGVKANYRILCNSPVPEKPLALACGLGILGRNSLVITPEAGSLAIIACMMLPFALEGDPPIGEPFSVCGGCSACIRACPTGAVRGDGLINRGRCIQWFASGNGEHIPVEVAEKWGRTLYGCTICQDCCPHNKRPIPGVASNEGPLPEALDARQLLGMGDDEIRALFKGTAMGISWLGPKHIRRNAELAAAYLDRNRLNWYISPVNEHQFGAQLQDRLSALGIAMPEVLLPASHVDIGKWAVIACDQFTQDKAYWEAVKQKAGDSPSTLNLIFPEIFLGAAAGNAARIENIHRTMKAYLAGGIFADPLNAFIYVERTTKNAHGTERTRRGLVANIDLEQYEWQHPETALIRATEQTVAERFPPRMDIRRGAALETPHVLVLMDDKDDRILAELGRRAKQVAPVYQSRLMLNSGSVSGWAMDKEEDAAFLVQALETLAQKARTAYGTASCGKASATEFPAAAGCPSEDAPPPFLFAVGDGNHSLASAKAVWDEYKKAHTGEAGLYQHPGRYAMVEIENLYDNGIYFEPIHRIIFSGDLAKLLTTLSCLPAFSSRQIGSREELTRLTGEESPKNRFGIVFGNDFRLVEFENNGLAVAGLQPLLDAFVKETLCAIDYIHGEEAVFGIAGRGGDIGILLPPVQKDGLFGTVAYSGPLPRKSFSMGDAEEKRFYLECRKLF